MAVNRNTDYESFVKILLLINVKHFFTMSFRFRNVVDSVDQCSTIIVIVLTCNFQQKCADVMM